MEERTGKSKVVELHEAASLLDLSADAVQSLTAAGGGDCSAKGMALLLEVHNALPT